MTTSTERGHAAPALMSAILLSAILLAVYARGGLAWPLGFVLLVPWLWALQHTQSLSRALLLGAAMSTAYVLAALYWFAPAVASYTGWPLPLALAVLALCAPLLQPQFMAYALVRCLAMRRHGSMITALASASAWVACEAFIPKLLGDTLGHGLQPSALLRQSADLWGAAGLSFVLLLTNAAVLEALQRTHAGASVHARLKPLAFVLALPFTLALYGLWCSHDAALDAPVDAARLRVAMVQSNITRYEDLRREIGAYAVVRRVLDSHYALSDQAIAEQHADALLWSETVYPTPFGHPRSADGAELDQEIDAYARSRQVPLVFGTYDIDGSGEYNAAAFLDPDRGLLGYYRKTHPFPLTEHVPAWLDSEGLRRALPWAGTWQPGHGPRVMPLRAKDGREVNVLPLICLDAVHPRLAIEGARLGAQAIVSLSNDAWFTQWPQGAELHLVVASFRSIETRLPQLRVTTNGISAVIDARGEILARTGMGEAAVLLGEIADYDPPPTLMLRLGDWVGRAGLLFLLTLALMALGRWLKARWPATGDNTAASQRAADGPGMPVRVLKPAQRLLIVLLHICVAAGLLWIGLRMLLIDGIQVNSLAQIERFGFAVLAPAFAAWALQRAFAARVWLEADQLRLQTSAHIIELPLAALAEARAWYLPSPQPGLQLRTRDGTSLGIATARASTMLAALTQRASPAPIVQTQTMGLLQRWAEHRLQNRHPLLDAAWLKLGVFPLLPALIAFHLHQVIAFGGPFGEWQTFGFDAWLRGLLLWWAAWVLGLTLFVAALRVLVEGVALVLLLARDLRQHTARIAPMAIDVSPWRAAFERGLRGVHYVGVPIWLLLRVL